MTKWLSVTSFSYVLVMLCHDLSWQYIVVTISSADDEVPGSIFNFPVGRSIIEVFFGEFLARSL